MTTGDNGRVTEPDQLRLLAVHAHPDDESSKGAATMAKYVAEGARVLVATCTGGERGSVLNPAMDRPEVWERLPQIRVEEMERAREILGVEQEFLGFVDSGLPEGDPLPPLPEGCFALVPLEEAAAPLVALIRRFKPQVITTYDERGGYPHPDHIKTHEISVHAFDAAGDPDRYPDLGEPWQPSKLYYHMSFTLPRTKALHEAILATGAESPVHRVAGQLGPGARHLPPGDDAGALRRVLPGPRRRAHRARDPDRPGGPLVRLPAGDPAAGVADRGLRAGPLPGGRRRSRRTICSPGSAVRWVCDDRAGQPARRREQAAPEDVGKSGPLGLLLTVLLLIAVGLLVRSMSKHLKRIPPSFDPPDDAERARHPGGAARAAAG